MTLARRTPLARGGPLKPMSDRRRGQLAAVGVAARTTLTSVSPLTRKAQPREARPRPKRPVNTGPSAAVIAIVDGRSGRMCEWHGCTRPEAERHHRLNRKAGGRHGAARERINRPAWLLGVCGPHHRRVTNPVGEVRAEVEAMGWVLREHQDAAATPVLTRHHPQKVWLDDTGGWHTRCPSEVAA